jgi:L-malate glycosyltransferase
MSKQYPEVVMFCPQFRPLIGGAERQAEKLAVAVAASGCRVKILTPRIDPDSPEREQVNGIVIERFPLNDLGSRYPVPGVALLNIPYIIWQVVRAIRPSLKGVDILHCHIASLQTGAAAFTGRLLGIPVLCKAAMAGHRSDLGEIETAGASGRLVAWLIRTVVGTWVATTAAVADALVRAGVPLDRIARIPNGAELPTGAPDRPLLYGARRFLYLGRLSKQTHRDVPTLIRAFDHVALAHQDMELAIVGDGDLYAETKGQVDACQARDRIQLPGFDRPEKWLAWADCFVLPSRREGLSNALLEAMAAGLPCIANDIPPNREVLDDGKAGVLVPVENCDALEAAMRDMVDERGGAKFYGQKARERVEQCYSIGAVAERYRALYEDLCLSKFS